jgi:hypothetical protein
VSNELLGLYYTGGTPPSRHTLEGLVTRNEGCEVIL